MKRVSALLGAQTALDLPLGRLLSASYWEALPLRLQCLTSTREMVEKIVLNKLKKNKELIRRSSFFVKTVELFLPPADTKFHTHEMVAQLRSHCESRSQKLVGQHEDFRRSSFGRSAT